MSTTRRSYPDAAWAPIHEEDIAAVGAHALLTDKLVGTSPVLTGPRSLTQAQMVAAIGTAIGRPLRFAGVPAEAAEQSMLRAGMPHALARAFLAMQAGSYGQAGLVTGQVEKIVGRPGLTYAEWAADHAHAFRH